MTRIFNWFFMWKMDPKSGFYIHLVFTLPPRDSTLQYKRCVHIWNKFPCIITLQLRFIKHRTNFKLYSTVYTNYRLENGTLHQTIDGKTGHYIQTIDGKTGHITPNYRRKNGTLHTNYRRENGTLHQTIDGKTGHYTKL